MNSLSTGEQKEIHEVLTEFGLHEKEKLVYITLLEEGPSNLLPLSRALRLPPTTVQSTLARLFEKGIIDISKRKSRQIYEALDPSIFKKLLEEKVNHFGTIIPLLQDLKKESSTKTKVRVFYRERMADIFREALQTKEKIIYEIVSGQEIQKIFGERFHFTKRRLEKSIHLKSLRVESEEIKKYSKERNRRELREAKFLPRETHFSGSIFFWDNSVALFTNKAEGLAILIESRVTREMISQLFEILWSIGRRMDNETNE